MVIRDVNYPLIILDLWVIQSRLKLLYETGNNDCDNGSGSRHYECTQRHSR